MRIVLVFLLLELGIYNNSNGQEIGFDPKSGVRDISISQWTDEDGLSSNNVTSVFQDSKGLIWITSFNGVMLYDGERIEIYDINNLNILETDGFYTVVENDQGIIFFGSQGSGLVKYDNGEFKVVDPKGEILPKSIPSLLVSQSGIIYIGSNNNGLYALDGGNSFKVDIPELNQSTITSIVEHKEGRLWVATEDRGMFYLNNGKLQRQLTTENGLLDNHVKNLAYTSDGWLMIATTNGLQHIDPMGELHTVESLAGVYINYLLVDGWNSVWAGAELGLVRWNREQNKTNWFYGKRGIDLVRISSLIMDKENSLWLTSSRTGLIRLKESMLSNMSKPQLASNRVNIVHQSWDGNLYIGTDQNRIDVRSGNNYSHITIKTDLGGNGIRDIYHDPEGSFWLATYVGIIHKQGIKEKVYSTETGMPANNFRTVLKDQRGDMWFGSRSGGLVKFRKDRIVEVFNNGNRLKSNFVLSVTESVNGDIYVGTHSGGMTVFEQSGKTQTYHLKDDDSGVLLFNIDMTSDSTALVTANIGLLNFDGNDLKLVQLVSDRRSKTYFDLIDDQAGNLWMTSNLGILQINSTDWSQYQSGRIDQLPYQLLDENNGMDNRECTGATRSILSSDGRVLIPTLGGVCEVNPRRLKQNSLVPNVQIRNVFVDNDRLNPTESNVSIEAGALRYIFEFAVLSYTAPERNQFKYILEGFDKNWSSSEYDGRVEYTNLQPGKYTFRVIGANESQIWNRTGASYTFRVKPFFYQTVWFYLLILLFIVVIFLVIYRWRISFINRQNVELKKVNAELDRFVYSASHEIRSPLSSILGLINLARMGDTNKRVEYLDHIEKSVNRLDEFIHDIVDYSRNARLGIEVQKVDFETTISNILEDISHTANFEKIRCDLSYKHTIDFYSDPSRLKVVLSNIITNAFKHHRPENVEKPFVSIQTSDYKESIQIQVTDNGPGIDKKHQNNVFDMFYRATTTTEGSGLGLYIVEETLEKLHGTVHVNSDPNSGSSFTIMLKNLKPV